MRSYFPTTLALTVTRFCNVGILEASLLGRSYQLACGEAARAPASYLMKACCHDRTINSLSPVGILEDRDSQIELQQECDTVTRA